MAGGMLAAGSLRRWPTLVLPAALALLLLVLAPPAQAQASWEDAEETVVLDDLEGPIDIAISPEGAIWWNGFYSGNVTRYDPGEDEREVRFHADPIPDPVERGLVGLALDPNVTDNGVFYVYYTVEDPDDPERGTNHLSRIEDGEETILLEVPAHMRHNGGRIVFDDEGRLFVSTGDNTEGHPAQDPSSRLGKILHLHPDGTPAEDTIEGDVYSLGHRNVYGLAYDEDTGRLFATENNDLERDEVNLIEPGGNYGWPECQGTVRYDFEAGEPTDEPCQDPAYTGPIGEFYPDYTAVPTGATMFEGDLYWAAWTKGTIHRMVEDPETGTWQDYVVHETDGRINDITTHDGAVYYANWTSIVRIDGVLDDGSPPDEAPDPDGDGSGSLVEVPTPGLAVMAVGLGFATLAGRHRRGEG